MSFFKTAAIFSNSCVLQRNKVIDIFGTTTLPAIIKVELSKGGKVISANESWFSEGKWCVSLPKMDAQTGFELKIIGVAGDKTHCFSFTDVAVGEVWLCGGQSNMEFELQNCTEGPDALAEAADPNVRFYYTQKKAWLDDDFYASEANTAWQKWDSDGKKAWSAVGFFFAKKLASDLGITVGLIGCNWGGTSASAWMSEDRLASDSDLKSYLDEQEAATRGISEEYQIKAYNDYLVRAAEWDKRAQKVWAVNPTIDWEELQQQIGKNEYPGPRACNNPYRPSGLYKCMLQRIMPYTMKGVLWYQGESDDHKPAMYRKLLTRMIENWRTDWHDPDLPFVVVQLPGHRNKNDPDFKHWPLIRQAQAEVCSSVSNVYLACALDLGAYNDIHPKFKKCIADRMETIVLCKMYRQIAENTGFLSDNDFTGIISPVLESAQICKDKIIIQCENASAGFEICTDNDRMDHYISMEKHQGRNLSKSEIENWTGFEIAGSDGNFVPAKVVFDGSKIHLSSPDIKYPKEARYSWFNYSPIVVYGKKNHLPLAPFWFK